MKANKTSSRSRPFKCETSNVGGCETFPATSEFHDRLLVSAHRYFLNPDLSRWELREYDFGALLSGVVQEEIGRIGNSNTITGGYLFGAIKCGEEKIPGCN